MGLLRDIRRHDGLGGPVLVATALAVCAWAGWRVQPPAPRPTELVEHYRANARADAAGGRSMSVMLISVPRDTAG